ncbi:C-C motif chemokine 3-like [Silurus asotus]|uniref:C-C motif chemokine 3-like n=1 Tax=Silurus asotus TaxID=30991 RepID=A0AAD5B142_SILAS|nr:C-C motif chemokine 3-like [Silurus asotus]
MGSSRWLRVITCFQYYTECDGVNEVAGLCCFKFHKPSIPAADVVSVEQTRSDCTLPGVSLTTKKGYRICVDPEVDWVKEIIKNTTTARNLEAAPVLVQSLVISRLDYCNSLLAGLPMNAIRPQQMIQNAAARLVFNQPKFSHTTPLLRSLYWVPKAARIRFKTLMLAYKAKI